MAVLSGTALGITSTAFAHAGPTDQKQTGGQKQTQAAPAEWARSTLYQAGQQVTRNGITYQALQTHKSASTWTPENTPALWTPLGKTTAPAPKPKTPPPTKPAPKPADQDPPAPSRETRARVTYDASGAPAFAEQVRKAAASWNGRLKNVSLQPWDGSGEPHLRIVQDRSLRGQGVNGRFTHTNSYTGTIRIDTSLAKSAEDGGTKTLTHELGHALGLVDEYGTSSDGDTWNGPCNHVMRSGSYYSGDKDGVTCTNTPHRTEAQQVDRYWANGYPEDGYLHKKNRKSKAAAAEHADAVAGAALPAGAQRAAAADGQQPPLSWEPAHEATSPWSLSAAEARDPSLAAAWDALR
ncbi:snapalysin family zinc-dependent metalloprotease [Streptomyces sp. NPDC047023]|uniref:snapalysin family zinc-dependent metalloprotease n=1 Tax=Streptomyces sp. NPDC047023 TaxID=3155139 RepID=UPI0033C11AF2